MWVSCLAFGLPYLSEGGGGYVVQVDHPFISKMEEDVLGMDGISTALLVAKNKINPAVEICADMVAL